MEIKLKIENSEQASVVKNRIVQLASGGFLWVVLIVRLLNEDSDRGYVLNLASRLEEIPKDLDELFRLHRSQGHIRRRFLEQRRLVGSFIH